MSTKISCTDLALISILTQHYFYLCIFLCSKFFNLKSLVLLFLDFLFVKQPKVAKKSKMKRSMPKWESAAPVNESTDQLHLYNSFTRKKVSLKVFSLF